MADDQYLSNDVIGVIMLYTDLRTTVRLASVCHSIKLPTLSRWTTVVNDREKHDDIALISNRRMLRVNPPIPHGITTITYGHMPPARIMYDRGRVIHAYVDRVTWLGSRRISVLHGHTFIEDKGGSRLIEYNGDNTTIHSGHCPSVTFRSRPKDESAIEVLRWYAEVVPDTHPAVPVTDMLESAKCPIPRWLR